MAVGPLVRTWTMRYEAKNSFFKCASHIGNFKNIVLTLANRHQRWICYQQASGKLLDRSLECGPGQNARPINAEPDSLQEALKAIIPEIDPETTVFRPFWIKKAPLCTRVQTVLKSLFLLQTQLFSLSLHVNCITYHSYSYSLRGNRTLVPLESLGSFCSSLSKTFQLYRK